MALVHRDLSADELELLATIDRAEHIDGQYVVEDGGLHLVRTEIEVPGWYPSELAEYVTRLHDLHAAGGVVIGSWDGSRLVGLASLDVRPVGGHPRLMKLDMLYVDVGHRGGGIGGRLVRLLGDRARTGGATALYISATPTRNTVDAYVHLGATLADPPDPYLLALEPDDIHLILALAVRSTS